MYTFGGVVVVVVAAAAAVVVTVLFCMRCNPLPVSLFPVGNMSKG
jgi:hypothetical protein